MCVCGCAGVCCVCLCIWEVCVSIQASCCWGSGGVTARAQLVVTLCWLLFCCFLRHHRYVLLLLVFCLAGFIGHMNPVFHGHIYIPADRYLNSCPRFHVPLTNLRPHLPRIHRVQSGCERFLTRHNGRTEITFYSKVVFYLYPAVLSFHSALCSAICSRPHVCNPFIIHHV